MTVVAICMLAIVAAQDSTSLKDEQQIREALARYPVKVRIYKDCIADPRNYQICYLKTDGTGFGLGLLKAAVHDITERSVIAVVDSDQDFGQVRQALQGCLAVARYNPDGQISLLARPWSPDAVTFTDGYRMPIPMAQIEVWVDMDPGEDMRVFIARSSTDAAGRAKGLPCCAGTVLHIFHRAYPGAAVAFSGCRPAGPPVIQLPVVARH